MGAEKKFYNIYIGILSGQFKYELFYNIGLNRKV